MMRQANGFTLVELLVAMVAGSFMLAALSWSVGSLGKELGSTKKAEAQRRADELSPALASLLERALPAPKDDSSTRTEREHLSLKISPPDALGPVGPVRLSLDVRDTGNRSNLVAHFSASPDERSLTAGPQEEILLAEGYRNIWFEYDLSEEQDAALPPRLITINLEDDEQNITKISATPAVNSLGACRFDPVSMTCRR